MAIIECTNPNPDTCATDGGAHHDVTYAGAVLRIGEHNWHDDSDFYAEVWDEKAQRVRKIEYATTRGWTYHNLAHVDATWDVIAKASAYLVAVRLAEREERRGQTYRKGMTARCTERGETLEGVIAWVGTRREYSRWAARYATPEARYGIRVEGRKGLVFRNRSARDLHVTVRPLTADERQEEEEEVRAQVFAYLRAAYRATEEREASMI